jgi:hypothetical protein
MSGVLISDLALNSPKALSNKELLSIAGGMTDIVIIHPNGTTTTTSDGVNNGITITIDNRPPRPMLLQ